jgi:hypothetical protein
MVAVVVALLVKTDMLHTKVLRDTAARKAAVAQVTAAALTVVSYRAEPLPHTVLAVVVATMVVVVVVTMNQTE